jgi:pyruvate,water dikinase
VVSRCQPGGRLPLVAAPGPRADGIGLARMEFIVSNAIQVHPMALVHFNQLQDIAAKAEIARLTARYDHKPDYLSDKLAHGFAALCAGVYTKPAIIRMSDFKTNSTLASLAAPRSSPRRRIRCSPRQLCRSEEAGGG